MNATNAVPIPLVHEDRSPRTLYVDEGVQPRNDRDPLDYDALLALIARTPVDPRDPATGTIGDFVAPSSMRALAFDAASLVRAHAIIRRVAEVEVQLSAIEMAEFALEAVLTASPRPGGWAEKAEKIADKKLALRDAIEKLAVLAREPIR